MTTYREAQHPRGAGGRWAPKGGATDLRPRARASGRHRKLSQNRLLLYSVAILSLTVVLLGARLTLMILLAAIMVGLLIFGGVVGLLRGGGVPGDEDSAIFVPGFVVAAPAGEGAVVAVLEAVGPLAGAASSALAEGVGLGVGWG